MGARGGTDGIGGAGARVGGNSTAAGGGVLGGGTAAVIRAVGTAGFSTPGVRFNVVPVAIDVVAGIGT